MCLAFYSFINTIHPLTHTQHTLSHIHTYTPSHHTGQKKKLSMIFGVTIPCCLSIFSVILFLRLGFVLGQVSPPSHTSFHWREGVRMRLIHPYISFPIPNRTHIHTLTFLPPHTHTPHHIHQAGYWQTIVMIVLGYSVVVLTVLSISAIATSATVEGGGVYCILIRLNRDHEYSRWKLASFLL